METINLDNFLEKSAKEEKGINAWPLQELLKGRISIPFESIRPLGSNVGGWGFNTNFYNIWTINNAETVKMLKECKNREKYYELKKKMKENGEVEELLLPNIKISPYVADEISDYLLRLQPFFKKGNLDKLFPTPENLLHGSYYAKENYNKLLSQFIPAVTKAVGARMVGKNMEINFDLNTNIKKFRPQGWPDERMNDRNKKKRWLHSDMKNVSYLYVYKLFDKYVELGGLDENKNIDLLDNN